MYNLRLFHYIGTLRTKSENFIFNYIMNIKKHNIMSQPLHLLLANCQSDFVPEHYQSEETKSLFGGKYTLIMQKYNRDYTHNIIRKDTTELFVIQNCYKLPWSEFSKNGIDYLLVTQYKQAILLDLTNQKSYSIPGHSYPMRS